jgi:hypothetical protein
LPFYWLRPFVASFITLVLSINDLHRSFASKVFTDELIEDAFVRTLAIDLFIIRVSFFWGGDAFPFFFNGILHLVK